VHNTAQLCNTLLRGVVPTTKQVSACGCRTATHCSIMQHAATHCNTLQHTASHGSILQHTATRCPTASFPSLNRGACVRVALQHAANLLQHTAFWRPTYCEPLQRVYVAPQHAAAQYNTLQLFSIHTEKHRPKRCSQTSCPSTCH